MTERPTFPIETDVPIWKRRGGTHHSLAADYKFDVLQPGHSFFVPAMSPSFRAVSQATSEYARLWPEKVFELRTTRDDPKHHMPGIRVWRTR